MGKRFVDAHGKVREVVQVACDWNETGYYTSYRDQMRPGEVEFGVTPEPSPDTLKVKASDTSKPAIAKRAVRGQ